MNVLIVYDNYSQLKPRQALIDHLLSFEKYSSHNIYYCNYAYGLPAYLEKVPFDLIFFHYFFASQFRWNGMPYEQYLSRLEPLKNSSAAKALFCQDEYVQMNGINRFINDFNINTIFTVAEESEWGRIYSGVDMSKVRIHKVLTGYLDDNIEQVLKALDNEKITRCWDIGYRASHINPALGRQGVLKVTVGEKALKACNERGLKSSIKTVSDEKEMFHGWDWYRFLLSCRGTVGVEGGSSILDNDGAIAHRVKTYLTTHSGSCFEEVEAACFPGIDGNLNLVALSPRHLEACATRTCQLLIEGDYSGVLKPGIHYLEIKRDFSNLDTVIEQFLDPAVRERITARAYDDIIADGRWRYSSFVEEVFAVCSIEISAHRSPYLHYNRFREWFLKHWMPWEFVLFPKIKKLLPQPLVKKLKALRNRC